MAQSHFVWDGANLLAELNGAGTGVVSEYSYYPGLDKLHAIVVGGQQYNAHADGLGNTIALTGADQGVKRTYAYDPWGQLTGGSDVAGFAGTDRVRFKGALSLGPEADFYYMRARWYEPKSGRFLSEDPIGLAGGINGYAFGADDPINLGDPTGEELVVIGGVAFECNTLDLGTGSTVTRCDAVEVGGVTVEGDPSGPPGFPGDPSMPGGGDPESGASGGAGSGNGARGARMQEAGPKPASCGLAIANAIFTGLTDLAFFTGVGAGIRAARAARLAMVWTENFGYWQMLRSMRAAHASAIAYRTARDFAYAGAEAAYTTGRFGQLGSVLSGSQFSGWDLVPGVASGRAIVGAVKACK